MDIERQYHQETGFEPLPLTLVFLIILILSLLFLYEQKEAWINGSSDPDNF